MAGDSANDLPLFPCADVRFAPRDAAAEVLARADHVVAAAYYRSEGAEAMRQITDLFHEKKMNRVVLTGMGSSLYAMDTVLSYLTGHGIPALSYSSFELSRFQFGPTWVKDH